MLNFKETNILGQICDSTYGRSSTLVSPTASFKVSHSGDTLTVTYTTIVHLASEQNLREQVRRHEEESVKLTRDYMSDVKKEFKSEAGRALKLKEVGNSDSVEIISSTHHSPRKIAYYRRVTEYEIG